MLSDKFRRPARGGRPVGTALLAALVTLGIAVPVLMILWRAFTGSVRGQTAYGQLQSYAVASLHSVVLGIAVVGLSSIIAIPLAIAVEQTPIGRWRAIDIVCLIPFMTPPYIASMGWILFVQPNGYMQQMLPFTAALQQAFFSFLGLTLIMSLHLFPIIYIGARQALVSIGGRVDEAARVHGLSVTSRILKIWTPPLWRAAMAAGILVFVKTIGEFGTPIVFGGMIHFSLLTTDIYQHISSWPISFSAASQLALILLVSSYLAWTLNDVYQRHHRYPLAQDGGAVTGTRRVARALAWAYFLSVMAVSVGIPYGVIATTSLLHILGDGVGWANFTLEHYIALFRPGSQALEAILTSFWLALAAASISCLIGSAIAAVIHFGPVRLGRYIDFIVLLPNMIPDILVIVGLILFWNAPWLPWTLYDTPWILVVSFVVLFLPYAVTYARQALVRLSPSLWEAGLVQGASRVQVGARILVPLMAPPMLAGWMFVFAISFRDLVAPMLISPPNLLTTSTYIFGQFSQGALSDGMAMSVVTIAVTVGILSLAQGTLQRTR